MMRSWNRCKGLVILLFISATLSYAGVWTVDRNVAGDDIPRLLLTDGILIKASNLGGGAAVTVGGVVFDANTNNVTGNFNAKTAYYSGVSADLKILLNFQASTVSTTTPATISISGLIIGRKYRMQMVTGWPWGWLKYRLTGAQGETVNLNWVEGEDGSPGINIATYVWTANTSNVTFGFISTQSGSWKPADVHAYSVYLLPTDTASPAAPTYLAAIPGDGTVFLDWADNAEKDLNSYTVYRSTTSGQSYTQISSGLTSSDYTDRDVNNGAHYYYVVTAVDLSGNVSQYSSEGSAIPSVYEVYSTKKGVGSNSPARIHALGSSWYYGWNINRNYDVDPDIEYVPMRHNKWWPNLAELANVNSGGFVSCSHFLAYNEPDHAGSEKPTVQEALDFWPQIETSAAQYGLQIGSAACSGSNNWWQNDFMTQAAGLGLQVDFMVYHDYPAPTNTNAILSHAQWYYNTYGKDVWLTEFNAADWGNTDAYTHGDSYTFMVETLYRLERTDYIKRYAIFPWDPSWGDPAEPAHVFEAESSAVLTPLGKLYAEYRSADINGPYPQVWYYLHNKNSDRRLHHHAGTPAVADVYTDGTAVQFELIDAGGGYCYIDNKNTHARLQYNGSLLVWVTAANQGTWVQWALADAGHGWKYITNREFNKRLSSTGTSLTVENTSSTGNSVKWAFVRSGTDYIIGDYSDDGKVDMADIAELGMQWQNGYDMNVLLDIANNWLCGTLL
ncbi:MAG: hypothetical protein JXB18_02065 [Sedimentisphaerales bacterium]|nr:hypothetical protein [Sedimentisphaerales bacterium]